MKSTKQITQERIQRDTEAFLAGGAEITRIPFGESAERLMAVRGSTEGKRKWANEEVAKRLGAA